MTTDRIGTSGTKGTRKPRGRSGCVLRRINTAMDTSTKANNVPMFERSASVPISKIPAGIPTKIPATHVATCGVLKRGCTLENAFGNNPSRDIANHTRACPS